jgi:hypothetical protein
MNDEPADITRADLAAALADLAESDSTVAKVLAACEAWEVGYMSGLFTRAEVLASNDPQGAYTSISERALSAIDRAIRLDNPFQRVHSAGVNPSPEAVTALIDLLRQQAKFHGASTDLERRGLPRIPPPAPSEY